MSETVTEIDTAWMIQQLRLTGAAGLHLESLAAMAEQHWEPKHSSMATIVQRHLTILRRAGRVQRLGRRWSLTASEYLRGPRMVPVEIAVEAES